MPTVVRQTVESFHICLEHFDQVLQAKHPISHIEGHLLAQLDQPLRLLRWAIVKVENTDTNPQYWCEGAYLKTWQSPGQL
jgi:hypothetical protein